jgi:hypothetical protein
MPLLAGMPLYFFNQRSVIQAERPSTTAGWTAKLPPIDPRVTRRRG